MKSKSKYRKITIHMKTGRTYVHFSECIDEADLVQCMRAKTFGLETYRGGFAAYKVSDIERVELHG